jgi:hypothetical protein
MPRYYFVATNRNGRMVDSIGLILPSDQVANAEARAALRVIQAEDPGADWDSWAVEIFDSSKEIIARIQLGGPALGSSSISRRKRGLRGHGRAVARTAPSALVAFRPPAAPPRRRGWLSGQRRSARS